MKPLLLDLFCGAGGAAMGYSRAGFDVIGVDIEPQPHYPFRFIQADALTFPLEGFDAIHASPPCQDHSALATRAGLHGTGWMLAATRERLQQQPRPWAIENVNGAPLAAHFILCGSMFGLTLGRWQLRRHRLFETSGWFGLTPPCAHNRPALGVYGHGSSHPEGHPKGSKASAALAREIMRIDWMTMAELGQAIPPAYTEYIGQQLMEALSLAA